MEKKTLKLDRFIRSTKNFHCKNYSLDDLNSRKIARFARNAPRAPAVGLKTNIKIFRIFDSYSKTTLKIETPPTDTPKTDNSCPGFPPYLSVFLLACLSFLFFEFRVHIRNIGTLRDYKRAFFLFFEKNWFFSGKSLFFEKSRFQICAISTAHPNWATAFILWNYTPY